jgi:hypothetical protein
MLWYRLFTNTYIEAKEIEKRCRMKCEWEKGDVDFREIESRFFRPWMLRPEIFRDNLNYAAGTHEQDFSRFATSPTGLRFESFLVLSILPKSISMSINHRPMIESTLIYLDFFLSTYFVYCKFSLLLVRHNLN